MRYPAGVLEFTGLRNYGSTTVLALRALEADDVTQWQNPIRQQPQTVHSSDLAPPHSWVSPSPLYQIPASTSSTYLP